MAKNTEEEGKTRWQKILLQEKHLEEIEKI